MYQEEMVRLGSQWYHPKTKAFYTTLTISTNSTNGEPPTRVVVYWSNGKWMAHHREIKQFLDGRFVPVGGDGRQIRVKDDVPCPEISDGR